MQNVTTEHFTIAVSSIATVLIPALISLITVVFTNIRKIKLERKYNAEQIEIILKQIEILKEENEQKDIKITQLENEIKTLQKENLELKQQNKLLNERINNG